MADSLTLGLLIYGDNHLLLRGPLPSPVAARRIVKHWMIVSLAPVIDRGGVFGPWRISTKEFREEITWVVIVEERMAHSPAIVQLVEECSARGVSILRCAGLDSPDGGYRWVGADLDGD